MLFVIDNSESVDKNGCDKCLIVLEVFLLYIEL